jgi:hypothetical protein
LLLIDIYAPSEVYRFPDAQGVTGHEQNQRWIPQAVVDILARFVQQILQFGSRKL